MKSCARRSVCFYNQSIRGTSIPLRMYYLQSCDRGRGTVEFCETHAEDFIQNDWDFVGVILV